MRYAYQYEGNIFLLLFSQQMSFLKNFSVYSVPLWQYTMSYRNCNARSGRIRDAMNEGISVARKQKNMLTPITTA